MDSPSSQRFNRSPTASPSQFLPDFLLGGLKPSISSPAHVSASFVGGGVTCNSSSSRHPAGGGGGGGDGWTSPTSLYSPIDDYGNARDRSQGSVQDVDMSGSSPVNRSGPWSPIMSPLSATNSFMSRSGRRSMNGPPIISLFDTLNESTRDSIDKLEESQKKMEPEGLWILVSGFPPSASSYIKSLFSQLGMIVDTSIPSNGSYLYLKYASRADARKALAFDEKVISGTFMITVREGKPSDQTSRKSFRTLDSPDLMAHNRSQVRSPETPRLRPLAVPKRINLPSDHAVPKLETGLMSKLNDFLFNGWWFYFIITVLSVFVIQFFL